MSRLREQNIVCLEQQSLDVLIVGGGINGAVSAAALTARGARIGLIDRRDFAGVTSSQSSNLVWGGIKYMESYEFGLVNDLCKSRNELLRSFPSTVKEIRFLTTVPKGFRFHPRFMILGTWLYWLFGRGMTRIPRLLSPSSVKNREPLVNVAMIHLRLGERSRACMALQRAATLRPEIPRGTQLRRRWCTGEDAPK